MKCYDICKESPRDCKNSECRHWVDSSDCKNCVIIGSADGPMTLQQIGDIFGITRMRVCQIEKKILSKIKPSILNER